MARTSIHCLLVTLLPALITVFYAVGSAEASIHNYDRDPFREVGNAYLVSGGSEGLAATFSVPKPRRAFHSTVHDGLSYIRFENLTFWRSKETADQHPDMAYNSGLIQIIIFEAADRDNIGGSPYGGQRSICCTPDLAKLEGCKQGEVIRTPSATDINWPVVLNVHFRGKQLSARMKNREVYIKKTGMYNLFFISCDPKLKGMEVTGKTLWKNPDGFLPGRMAPLMKFYSIMSLAYVILTAMWCFQYVRYWKDVLPLQHCIAGVIALGLFEMLFWYLDYSYFNNTGVRPVGLTSWVVTIGSIRRTISRILILSISMGYGVVRPTLGGLTIKVLLLGMTYFVASELLNITEYVGTINDVAGRARVFLVLPDAFLDAFLILWVFTSLSRTLEQLQAKRSSVKLDLYRQFSNALAVTIIASVAWIGYEVYFKATDPFNERWQSGWIITAFWDILAFALLCVICFLWAPSQSSQRYAYSDGKGEDSDDEETESFCKESPRGDISLVKMERKEGMETSDGEDEPEDGKRE
ncbi:PREDICTED: transmembrane protein 87A [Ipomoea nil]|uniref:transmembrane protein 87A n=1 Tax=Ipomoea nil TaxID=35883 RepID=UPI000901FEB4|nr:PREDICTED: transmembrane protein 87A [Ipomoea nil]